MPWSCFDWTAIQKFLFIDLTKYLSQIVILVPRYAGFRIRFVMQLCFVMAYTFIFPFTSRPNTFCSYEDVTTKAHWDHFCRENYILRVITRNVCTTAVKQGLKICRLSRRNSSIEWTLVAQIAKIYLFFNHFQRPWFCRDESFFVNLIYANLYKYFIFISLLTTLSWLGFHHFEYYFIGI